MHIDRDLPRNEYGMIIEYQLWGLMKRNCFQRFNMLEYIIHCSCHL